MAIKRTFTDEQERLFEQELLAALKRDPDHQFAFDGKLEVDSSRYGCRLRADNVFWDPEKDDIVFVGCCIGGKPVIDTSKGYPLVKTEVSIPFRECFEDLKKMNSVSPMYLVSKSRKAVIEKCIKHPFRLAGVDRVLRDGVFRVDDFWPSFPKVGGGLSGVGSVSCVDGEIYLRPDAETVSRVHSGELERMPDLRLTKLSLADIQAIGELLLGAHAEVQKTVRDYLDIKNALCPDGRQASDRDVRMAEEAALLGIYEKGHPVRACHAVAMKFTGDNARVFDEMVHSLPEIYKMVHDSKNGQPFGFRKKVNLSSRTPGM